MLANLLLALLEICPIQGVYTKLPSVKEVGQLLTEILQTC